jgi:hypothetical protein
MAKGKLWDEVMGRMEKAFGKKDHDKGSAVETGNEEPGTEEEEAGEEGEIEDATPVVKELAKSLGELTETIETMAKAQTALLEQQQAMGDGMLAIMRRTEEIAQTPAPRKGAVTALEASMAKAGLGGAAAGTSTGRYVRFTQADMDEAKDILSKAVSEGKLTLFEVTRAEGQLNKAMYNPMSPIDPKFVNILCAGAQS